MKICTLYVGIIDINVIVLFLKISLLYSTQDYCVFKVKDSMKLKYEG